MAEYSYPAEDERGIITGQKDNEKWWNDIEMAVIRHMVLPHMKKMGTLVDIGAGEGKYSELFSGYFDEVIAIEPDKKRAAKIRKRISGKKLKIITSGVEKAKIGRGAADMALALHVTNHIPDHAVDMLIANASKWTRKGGYFLICFTHKTPQYSEYGICWMDGNKSRFVGIPKSIFDYAARHPEKGVLPVMKAHGREFAKAIERQGFKEMAREYYAADIDEKLWLKAVERLLFWLPIWWRHKAMGLAGPDNFMDVCVLFRKEK